jgi:hypothetical protein|nr:MAG TPA: hypothetical protein [Caudoviricetes sp.]
MNNASLRYDLENIDNLRYLLCLAREFFAETGMIPAELEYHGVRLSYNSIEANAVIKGALDEQTYIERNKIV